jgi:hypothetical protein
MSKILANQIANYGDDAPIEIKEGLNIPAGKPIQAAGNTGTSGQVLSTTGASIAWVDTFSGDYNNLINRPTIPAAQINSDWNASSGVGVILNKPAVPALPSVTVGAVGSSTLAYNSGNGEFTFTPPDLSGYLTSYTETDPVFAASAAGGITSTQVTNWGTAYGWGDHASGGYLTSYTETQTLDAVLTLGATTTQDITTTGKLYYSNNFADLTALNAVSPTTYHGMFAHVHAEGHGYFAHAGAWTQLLDTGSSIDDLADVNLTTAPQSGQVLAYDGSNWVATAAGGGGGGISLTDLSVSTASAGTTALSYNSVSGVFTYTPPDLSSYAQTANLTIANWDAAHGWGDHSTAGYAADTNVANWDAAHGWGDHAGAGYLTTYSETGTLADVTGRGATTSTNLTLGGTVQFNNNAAFANDKVLNFGGGSNGRILYVSATNSFDVRVPGGSEDLKLGAGTAVRITNENGLTDRAVFTASGATITGTLTAGGLTYPSTNGTSGDVLTSDGAGNVTWAASTGGGGGGGANVTISDTIPAGTPAAGDLWWESDSGRLKVYYTDVDSSQWVDASPPLTNANVPVHVGEVELWQGGNQITWLGSGGVTAAIRATEGGGGFQSPCIRVTFAQAFSATDAYTIQATVYDPSTIGHVYQTSIRKTGPAYFDFQVYNLTSSAVATDFKVAITIYAI